MCVSLPVPYIGLGPRIEFYRCMCVVDSFYRPMKKRMLSTAAMTLSRRQHIKYCRNVTIAITNTTIIIFISSSSLLHNFTKFLYVL